MGLLGLELISEAATAMSIVNGTFDSDLGGWHDASKKGSTSYDSNRHMAVLTSGPGSSPSAAVLIQGDDGLFSFNDAQTVFSEDARLAFDIEFAALTIDVEEPAKNMKDSFQVWLYDADDLSGASDTNLLSVLINEWLGNRQFSLDLSSLTGRKVALSFELNDEDDGFDYQVNLDNVRVQSQEHVIPLPGSLYLLCSGLLAEWLSRKYCKKIYSKKLTG